MYSASLSPRKEMAPKLLNEIDSERRNFSGGIYTAVYDGSSEVDPSLNQFKSIHKTSEFMSLLIKIVEAAQQGRALTDNLFVLTYRGANIVFRLAEEKNILKPEKVLRLLYAQPLKGIANKRYIMDFISGISYNRKESHTGR